MVTYFTNIPFVARWRPFRVVFDNIQIRISARAPSTAFRYRSWNFNKELGEKFLSLWHHQSFLNSLAVFLSFWSFLLSVFRVPFLCSSSK